METNNGNMSNPNMLVKTKSNPTSMMEANAVNGGGGDVPSGFVKMQPQFNFSDEATCDDKIAKKVKANSKSEFLGNNPFFYKKFYCFIAIIKNIFFL